MGVPGILAIPTGVALTMPCTDATASEGLFRHGEMCGRKLMRKALSETFGALEVDIVDD